MATRKNLVALETFALIDEDGATRIIRAGDVVAADDPATLGRGELFAPAETPVQKP